MTPSVLGCMFCILAAGLSELFSDAFGMLGGDLGCHLRSAPLGGVAYFGGLGGPGILGGPAAWLINKPLRLARSAWSDLSAPSLFSEVT
ncbi:hypothetical protein V8F06_009705 [Rhypophila decipiens]